MIDKKKTFLEIANDCALKDDTSFTKQELDNIAFITLDQCIKQLAPFLTEKERGDFLVDIVCMIDGRERSRQYETEVQEEISEVLPQ